MVCIVTELSIERAVAAVFFVKKVSYFGLSERFFYQFTKPFQEFELLPSIAEL